MLYIYQIKDIKKKIMSWKGSAIYTEQVVSLVWILNENETIPRSSATSPI